jgi:hypothetical protein
MEEHGLMSKPYSKGYQIKENEKSPAVGLIKEVVEKLLEISNTIETSYQGPDNHVLNRDAHFILEGVRTNGNGRLTGIVRLRKEIHDGLSDIEAIQKVLDRNEKRYREMLRLINDNFDRCSSCNGTKGESLGHNWWNDCDACCGQGMVQKLKLKYDTSDEL